MPTSVPAGAIRHTGGCLQPVLLRGRADYIDGGTGELIHRYTTVHEPGGVLPIACKTRRASRCPPCAAHAYALGGALVLPQASCRKCAGITSGVERHVAKSMWDYSRVQLGLPSRRPKERPKHFTLSRPDGYVEHVPIGELPPLILSFKFPMAGMLLGPLDGILTLPALHSSW